MLRITALMDNKPTENKALIAEHGLSLYVEYNGRRILFDCGSGANPLRNAHRLGINLKDLDAVVISHSHYDHAAGYRDLTENDLGSSDLYTGPNFFEPKYAREGVRYTDLSAGFDAEFLDEYKINHHEVCGLQQLMPGVYLISGFPRVHNFEKIPQRFVRRTSDGFVIDDFGDEVCMALEVDGGLYATHCLVPPTPGPIAMAGALGADLGLTILVGLIVSIPAVIVAILYAKKVASKIDIPANSEYTLDELREKYGKLPGTWQSFAPLLLPIILIGLASVVDFPNKPLGTGLVYQIIMCIGNPVVALLLGVFLALTTIPESEKKNTLAWVTQGVTDSAGILAITCAGSSFGAILKCMPIAASVGGLVNSGLGVLIPFIIAMILKLAMGASTVAMITTAGMMAPLMEAMGFTSPLGKVIVVLAIGAGSMVASHANDSYFWVVSQFSDMKTDEAYKCQTGMTAVMGITIIALLFVVSLFI